MFTMCHYNREQKTKKKKKKERKKERKTEWAVDNCSGRSS